MTESTPRLILASASRTRADLLRAAGLAFDIVPAELDEAAIKRLADDPSSHIEAEDLALLLAQTKAVTVSQQFPGALVIGADQTLLFDGRLLDKPADSAGARQQLLMLRGQTHTLDTAAACARDGDVLWTADELAQLSMREFSTRALGDYLAAAGSDVGSSVGGYKIEGTAIQLFDRIEGDYFAILGLPLLALLRFLRERGVLVT